MRNFILMWIALVLLLLLSPLALAAQCIRYPLMGKPISELWFAIAIGLDQLGGSILYAEPDWTISSRTYFLRKQGNPYAYWFEKLINLFFGKDHCEESYQHEFGTNSNKTEGATS